MNGLLRSSALKGPEVHNRSDDTLPFTSRATERRGVLQPLQGHVRVQSRIAGNEAITQFEREPIAAFALRPIWQE